MSLKNVLEKNHPRDRGGPVASNRMTFQLSWALFKLLELHKSGRDYVMILDYYDDIAVVDSSTNPTSIDFFQVKTKDPGVWTLNSLIKSRKSKGKNVLSIIGKMYHSKTIFPDHVSSINLISNTKFKVGLSSNLDSLHAPIICVCELSEEERKKISDKLKIEHETEKLLPYEETTNLMVTDLAMRDHENHTLSYVMAFLDVHGPQISFRVRTFTDTVAKEIRKKNNCEWTLTGFENIIKYKAIERSFIESLVNSVSNYPDLNSKWSSVSHILTNEGMHFSTVKDIGNKWKDYEIHRMNPENLTIQILRKQIQQSLRIHSASESPTLLAYVSIIKESITESAAFTDNLLTAAILIEYYEDRKH